MRMTRIKHYFIILSRFGDNPLLMLSLALVLATCKAGEYICPSQEKCVTAKECAKLKLIAFKIRGKCDDAYAVDTASGFGPNEDGDYTCPKGSYTTVIGKTFGCVRSREDCGSMYVIDNENTKLCVDTPSKCNIIWWKSYNWTG